MRLLRMALGTGAAAALLALAVLGLGGQAGAANSFYIYDDSLHWSNWSWGTGLQTDATSPVLQGVHSMAITFQKSWSGASFNGENFDTSPYDELQFHIHPGSNPVPRLNVALYDQSGGAIRSVDAGPHTQAGADGWHLVSIPLSALEAEGRFVTRIHISEAAGTTPPTFHIDGLAFVGEEGEPTPAPTPEPPPSPPPSTSIAYIYDNSLYWNNWSWSTSVNAAATSPLVSGPNSMSVKYNAGWAGMSLQHAEFNTSGYTHLHFAINMAGQPLSGLSVGLYDMSSAVIKQINPQSYASAASGGWHIVSIPLVDLAGRTRPSRGYSCRRAREGHGRRST